MGLNTDQVVAVPQTFAPVIEKSRAYKARVKEISSVVNVTMSFILPGHKNAVVPIKVRNPGQDESSKIDMNQAWTDSVSPESSSASPPLLVIIACLGLVGLSSFTAERRTKEIGVRKVLGASTPNLFGMRSSEFVRLVIVANVLAWPIAYAEMNNWLDGFAYRVELGWTTFILAGLLAMAIALLTVGFQAMRAATANPVEALRTE